MKEREREREKPIGFHSLATASGPMEVDGHARSGSVNVPFFSSFFFGAVPGRPLRPFEADGAAVSSLTRSASLRCVTSASSSSSSSSFGFSWVLPFLCARSPWRPTTICRRNRVGVSRTSKCSSITSRYEEERKLGNQRQNPKPNKKKNSVTHTLGRWLMKREAE